MGGGVLYCKHNRTCISKSSLQRQPWWAVQLECYVPFPIPLLYSWQVSVRGRTLNPHAKPQVRPLVSWLNLQVASAHDPVPGYSFTKDKVEALNGETAGLHIHLCCDRPCGSMPLVIHNSARLTPISVEQTSLWRIPKWEFPKIGVPYFGILIIGILLFRVLYEGPLFSETPES